MSFKKTDILQWCLEEPLENAYVLDGAQKPIPVPADLLALPLPIQPGDRVLLGDTGIAVPIDTPSGASTPTFHHLLRAIEKGLQERLSPEDKASIQATYTSVGKFKYSEDRICHIRKFEAGKLKAKHILGEAIYFHGGLRRSESSKTWSYRMATD